MMTRWVLPIVVAALCACGATPRPSAPEGRGVLIVRSPAAAAVLWIDDRPIGEVGRLAGGVRIGAGPRRVELRLDGHHTRYAEVELRPGETRILELTLVEVQP